jgi:predicted DNA-binding transcriptional regulator YafY
MPPLKHQTLTRYRAIELIALWEGRLITAQLMDWFGITRQQASADINRYNKELNAQALLHSPSIKGYIPASGFKPVLSSGHINEYLELLTSNGSQPINLVLESQPGVAAVQLPERAVRPDVVRELVKACRNRASLKIAYSSMRNPEQHERVISPHTLIYSGFRWHVRAFCHKAQSYRDFLLSRISGTPQPSDEHTPSCGPDTAWDEQITLHMTPNQHLSEAQRAMVARDYAMTDGQLPITVRKALAHYTLQRYQAAITDEQCSRGAEHPIQLSPEDREQLLPYLFGSEVA